MARKIVKEGTPEHRAAVVVVEELEAMAREKYPDTVNEPHCGLFRAMAQVICDGGLRDALTRDVGASAPA